MRWRTERKGDAWVVFDPKGTAWSQAATRDEAKALLVDRARLAMAPAAPVAPAEVVPGATRPFESLMVVEGRWTGDDRLIMVDGLTWDGLLPLPLTSDHGADCDEIVGRIDEMERVPGATADERFIIGRGVLDISDERGQTLESKIEGQFLKGVSVDLDSVEEGGVDPTTVDPSDDVYWLYVVETARVRALALCAIPAFAEAYITLGTVDTKTSVPAIDGPTPIPADEVPIVDEEDPGVIIIASGHTVTIPDVPPAEWFTEPTDVAIEGALTVTDEGRVYGLIAPANVAHIGRADGLRAPMGNVSYDRFLRGETPVDGGGRVVTGNLTMACGHGGSSSSGAVTEHYDNSCSLVATITVGENQRGIWAAGALLPGVTADQVRRMMALQLSGHWMPTPTGYELCGALLVPVTGYPMARRQASVTMRDGQLVASAVPVRFQPTEASAVPSWFAHLRERQAVRAAGDCGCGDGSAERIEALEATVRRLEAQRLTAKLKAVS